MFKPVKSRKVYLEIVAQMKDIIEQGVLKAGDKLPSELELSKQFNASRTSVREALAALEISGLIETRRGNGNYIKEGVDTSTFFATLQELSSDIRPFELLEARKYLEGGIISLAVRKATPEKIKELEDILEEMSDVDVNSAWNEVNTRFHFCITEMADNALLLENMKYIVENMKNFVFWRHMEAKSLDIPGRLRHFYNDHVLLVECIKNGDEKRAIEITMSHLEATEEDFLNL